METIYDIIINLGCTFISFLVGIFVHKTFTKIKQRGKLRVIGMFKNGNDLAIALTTREATQPTSSLRATMSEVLALADLIPSLRQLSVDYSIVKDNRYYDINNSSNLLSIGGPKANIVTAKFFEKYGDKFPIKISTDPFSIVIGNKTYKTIYTEDNNKIVADYGVVIMICNKDQNNINKCSIVLFGGRGFGTRGTVQCLLDQDLSKKYKRYSKNDSFVAVIRIEENENDIETSIVEFYPLDSFS